MQLNYLFKKKNFTFGETTLTMKEAFLHYLWKYQLYDKLGLATHDGLPVKILHPGLHSKDAGPDFIDARIEIEGTLWAGNVEIHIASSDWEKHGHQTDKAYNNVILHVVSTHDKDVCRSDGSHIPVLVLKFDPKIHQKYTMLEISDKRVPCENYIQNADNFFIHNWLDALLVQRLELKASLLEERYLQNNGDLEETFYQTLLRNLGLRTNNIPFEQLAIRTPLKHVQRISDDPFRVEALLFGQAGFLGEDLEGDEYYSRLKREYTYLQKKWLLQPMEKHLWKFLRLRPVNFPTLRIAQLAAFIAKSRNLFSVFLEMNNTSEVQDFMSVKASGYWDSHYNFGKLTSTSKPKYLGHDAIKILLINTVVPMLFYYGKSRGLSRYCDKAMDWLNALSPEKNAIVDYWEKIGVVPCNAFDSQALLQLRNEYCCKRNCLECQIGNLVLTGKLEQ